MRTRIQYLILLAVLAGTASAQRRLPPTPAKPGASVPAAHSQPAQTQPVPVQANANGAAAAPANAAQPATANAADGQVQPAQGSGAAKPSLTPKQMMPAPPRVTFADGRLTVLANNSTVEDVLTAVRGATGTKFQINGGPVGDRLFGQFGPGTEMQVLQQILKGSGFSYVLVSPSQAPGNVETAMLMPKAAEAPAPGNAAQPQQAQFAQAPPEQVSQPGFPQYQGGQQQVQQQNAEADNNNGDQQDEEFAAPEPADQQQQPQQQQQQQMQNNVNGFNPSYPQPQPQQQQQGTPGDPNGQAQPKTPEQLLQELQRLQIQQQQQMQQQQQQNGGQAPQQPQQDNPQQ